MSRFTKGRARIAILSLVCLAFGLMAVPIYLASAEWDDAAFKAALERRIAMLEETAIASPADLQQYYRDVQIFTLPIAPPAPDAGVNCEEGYVVFDPKDFEGWTEALEPVERHGVKVYPVIVSEDPDTRETLFLNSQWKEGYKCQV